jgi:hypothetical protein
MNFLLKALVKKLEGEIEVAKANITVYTRSSTGIGEHPEVVEAIESQIAKIAEAEDKLNTIQKHFS